MNDMNHINPHLIANLQTALGVFALPLAVVFAVLWGFGLDRFGTLAVWTVAFAALMGASLAVGSILRRLRFKEKR